MGFIKGTQMHLYCENDIKTSRFLQEYFKDIAIYQNELWC